MANSSTNYVHQTGLRYIKTDFGIVYCAINKVTGHRYVGSTLCSLHRRKYRHEREKSCSKLHDAILHYGKESFDWVILEHAVPKTELVKRENIWIDKFDSMNPLHGYNLMKSGKGGKHTDESKAKLSESLKKTFSCEIVRKRLSEAHKKTYLDPNVSAKQSAAWGCRPFEAFKDGKSYGVFVTYKQAATALGFSISGIQKTVKGFRKQCHGFTFKYVEQ